MPDPYSAAEDGASAPYVETEPFPYTDELYLAIGRVAAESALAEALLSEIVSDVSSDQHYLFGGMSFDTLFRVARRVVEYDFPVTRRWDAAAVTDFLSALDQLQKLIPLRNAVVHGTWRREFISDDEVRPRPWGGGFDGPDLYYCIRHRYLNDWIEQAFTLGDLVEMAELFRRGCDRVAVAYVVMEAPNRRDNPLPRWVILDDNRQFAARERGQLTLLRRFPPGVGAVPKARPPLRWLTPVSPPTPEV